VPTRRNRFRWIARTLYLGTAECYFVYLALVHVKDSQVSAINDWLGRITMARFGVLTLSYEGWSWWRRLTGRS
jgi:hypothetical protein